MKTTLLSTTNESLQNASYGYPAPRVSTTISPTSSILDPQIAYMEATKTDDSRERARLLNEALAGFLTLPLQSPNEAWHYNVGCCYYALNEPGAALFHFLFAKTLAPRNHVIDVMIQACKGRANLAKDSISLYNAQPFWNISFLSETELKIILLIGLITGTLFGAIACYTQQRGIKIASLFLMGSGAITGVVLFARIFLTPIGVIIQAETLAGTIPPRIVTPGEEVYIEAINQKGYQVKTGDGQQGFLSKNSCWPLI
jgi:hypothetical protein